MPLGERKDSFEETPRPSVGPVKARQGLLGRPVLIVLVVAIVLAMIAWWGAELFGVAIEPPADAQIGNPADVEPVTN